MMRCRVFKNKFTPDTNQVGLDVIILKLIFQDALK